MATLPVRCPTATYRLQFSAHLRFAEAQALVPYFEALGISDAYPSPLFRAREGSSHGYDVVDHNAVDPQFGSEDDFRAFAEALRGRNLGLMLDVVPNHMGIDDPHNTWWLDVLENGHAAAHAGYFDIDWNPPKETLRERVLLPFLGEQYGRVLENQELRLMYQEQRFQIGYYQRRFPVAPRSWGMILEDLLRQAAAALPEDHPQRMELESIVTAITNLPSRSDPDAERIQHRYRESAVIRRRFAALLDESPLLRQLLEETLSRFNGRPGEPHSFDRLEALLAQQVYRLSYWRVASDEINYRRFFDINALAAIRVERPEVFAAVHAMVMRFLEQGWVTALRIDHPDGLLDPLQYFHDLQETYAAGYRELAAQPNPQRVAPPLYVAVEKILVPGETLDPRWPVAGTTGYDLLNLINNLGVDRRGVLELRAVYARFLGERRAMGDVLYHGKRAILNLSMSSELHVLGWELDRISEQHRFSRDFTRTSLLRTLREVIACFPVYRTYIRPDSDAISDEDRRRIQMAIRTAKRRNPEMSPSFFDFLGSVLLLEDPEGITEQQRRVRRQFVLKFQQVTGPVMAKGMEDTAFYRYYPLASLAEVGGDPSSLGLSLEQFHEAAAARHAAWPCAMSATATHDTKRGEDLRARLNVLSELPGPWEQAIQRWHQFNERHTTPIEGEPAPDRNEEYLIYQTLVGTWPLQPMDEKTRSTYAERIVQYADKAFKEAKVHTSWVNPDAEYGDALARFIRNVLDPRQSRTFLEDLGEFVERIAEAGFINGLAQVLLKICLPGVPDFYQGTELWDFSLVDPDNRRPVDFALRRRLLTEQQAQAADDLPELVADLLARWPDAAMKLFVTWRALAFRQQHAAVFLQGNYQALQAEGPQAEHLCALARQHAGAWAVAVAPRLCLGACQAEELALAAAEGNVATLHGSPAARTRRSRIVEGSFGGFWKDTRVRLPPEARGTWTHVLTGDTLVAGGGGTGAWIDVEDLLARFPVALLAKEQSS